MRSKIEQSPEVHRSYFTWCAKQNETALEALISFGDQDSRKPGRHFADKLCERLYDIIGFTKGIFSMLQAGTAFPAFSLPNQDGKTVQLSDFAGQWLVIYFYPKDDTPGCTIQGKSFTASKADYDKAGVHVLGVSADDVASHKNFCDKFAFKVELLADPNSTLISKLGIGQAEWKGMKFWERTSFVVDPKGVIRKVYEKVSPEGHEQVLLNDIQALKAGQAA